MPNSELYKARMSLILDKGSIGSHFVDKTNMIVNKTFANDQNYRKGMFYDWDMSPIEMVEFKFEKVKTHTAEGVEVEYYIHFRPDFNPESHYKDLYFKKDGRERFGFYIDVYDISKDQYDKWLIVGKDDRVSFDRYNAFKCNWMFEWVNDKKYHRCLGCVRDASDSSFNNADIDKLGGTTVDGELSILVPTNSTTQTILLGQRFIVSDNQRNPQTYEVVKIKDVSPYGVTRAYCKQIVFNPHKDFYGEINASVADFVFDLPIDDLPDGFGGSIHMICDCIKQKKEDSKPSEEMPIIRCSSNILYIKGQPVIFETIIPESYIYPVIYKYLVDEMEYSLDEIKDYFTIEDVQNKKIVSCFNRDAAKCILTVQLWQEGGSMISQDEVEVKL